MLACLSLSRCPRKHDARGAKTLGKDGWRVGAESDCKKCSLPTVKRSCHVDSGGRHLCTMRSYRDWQLLKERRLLMSRLRIYRALMCHRPRALTSSAGWRIIHALAHKMSYTPRLGTPKGQCRCHCEAVHALAAVISLTRRRWRPSHQNELCPSGCQICWQGSQKHTTTAERSRSNVPESWGGKCRARAST